jgi:hypothetical protein
MNILHATLSNATGFKRILALEPSENMNWSEDDDSSLFDEIVTSLQDADYDHPLEICGIICDNCPGQVNNLRRLPNSEMGINRGFFTFAV